MSAAARKSKSILRVERALDAQLQIARAGHEVRDLTTPDIVTALLAEEMALTGCRGGLTKAEALEKLEAAWDMAASGMLPRSGFRPGSQSRPLVLHRDPLRPEAQ